jgi:RNA polymerase sigma factor (sigma-70 family)
MNFRKTMITEDTARKMMKQLSELRKTYAKTKSESDRLAYSRYETECLNTLKYFVQMKTGKYRKFANYEDLNQEGLEALLKAMKTFKNNKGSFFFWAGLFVNTRLVRSANNHTVIRYPMHVAKKNKPHKENVFPILLDLKSSPEKACEQSELNLAVQAALRALSTEQRELVSLVYGFDGDKPMSITKVCEKKKISRANCIKTLNGALDLLRSKIEV